MEELRAEALKVLVRLLRAIRGWDQAGLAAAADMTTSSICHYETGHSLPPRRTVERLTAAVGLPASFVNACLLPAIEAACAMVVPLDLEKGDLGLEQALTGTVRSAFAAVLGALEKRAPWERDGRQQALDAWSRLEPCTPEERLFLVEFCREFQTRPLAELLRQASEGAASGRADRVQELARLACRVTELAPREEA